MHVRPVPVFARPRRACSEAGRCPPDATGAAAGAAAARGRGRRPGPLRPLELRRDLRAAGPGLAFCDEQDAGWSASTWRRCGSGRRGRPDGRRAAPSCWTRPGAGAYTYRSTQSKNPGHRSTGAAKFLPAALALFARLGLTAERVGGRGIIARGPGGTAELHRWARSTV